MYDTLYRVSFDDYTILAQLLLNQNNLLRAFDHKITTRIKRTLRHSSELRFIPASEDTFVAPQHNRQSSNVDVGSAHDVFSSSVLNSDENGSAVSDIA